MEKHQNVCDLGAGIITFQHAYGSDASKKNGLLLWDENILVQSTSCCVTLENINNHEKRTLSASANNSIACVSMHHLSGKFAVGEKGFKPDIRVYQYSDFQILQCLQNGTERGYSCMDFNKSGEYLVSLGTAPDFMLTIWNLVDSRILLHAKAFSQEIYTVKFSPYSDDKLVTCGTGHIRFWTMTSTFTGLKLEGKIGKFGKAELSDIVVFAELPDGKVVSGTETGHLLVWEGNFMKCRLKQNDGILCHNGEITFLEYFENESCVVSAGVDGVIRFWDASTIASAEVDSDHSLDYNMSPLAEYVIENSGGIKHLIFGGFGVTMTQKYFFIATTLAGTTLKVLFNLEASVTFRPLVTHISRYKSNKLSTTILSDHHYGEITGVASSSRGPYVVTCGRDKTLRCWDYSNKKLLVCRRFLTALTCVEWLPNADHECVLAGFEDGAVRRFEFVGDADSNFYFKRTMAFKPHKNNIYDVAINNNNVLATCGGDGIVFFFDCDDIDSATNAWRPLGFLSVSAEKGMSKLTHCKNLQWHENGQRLLCSCSDGITREVITNFSRRQPVENSCAKFHINALQPYLFSSKMIDGSVTNMSTESVKSTTTGFPDNRMNLQLTSSIYLHLPQSTVIISGASSSVSTNHLVDFEYVSDSVEDIEVTELQIGRYDRTEKFGPKSPMLTFIQSHKRKNIVFVGLQDGSVIVRPIDQTAHFARLYAHSGGVTGVATSFDDKYIMTVGVDGVLAIHSFNFPLLVHQNDVLVSDKSAASTISYKDGAEELANKIVADMLKSLIEVNDTEYYSPTDAIRPGSSDIDIDVKVDLCQDVEIDAYSIQDAKLREEQDIRLRDAEVRKNALRKIISELKQEFRTLKVENSHLPSCAQLQTSDLMVDTISFSEIKSTLQKSVLLEHKRCAYEAEKSGRLYNKAAENLMKKLVFEEIELHGFSGKDSASIFVKSIRSIELEESARNTLSEIHNRQNIEENLGMLQDKSNSMDSFNATATRRLSVSASDFKRHQNTGKKAVVNTTAHMRRLKRQERKDAIAKHESAKPNCDPEIDNSRLIAETKKMLGDYKLKSTQNYTVPIERRVNVAVKRKQLCELEQTILNMRMHFNKRFLELRDKKVQNICELNSCYSKLRAIEFELCTISESGNSCSDQVLDPLEFPENRSEVTSDDIKRYSEIRAEKGWKNASSVPRSIVNVDKLKNYSQYTLERGEYKTASQPFRLDSLPITDETDFGLNVHPKKDDQLKFPNPERHQELDDEDKQNQVDIDQFSIPILMFAKNARDMKMKNATLTIEQSARKEERKRTLLYYKNDLNNRISKIIFSFNKEVDQLRLKRHQTVAEIKMHELRLATLFQEYQVLFNFEDRGSEIQLKQKRFVTEKSELNSQISENQSKIDVRKDEISEQITSLNSIMTEFYSLIPNSTPHGEVLEKIYNKKVKRRKKRSYGSEESDDENDNSESEEEDKEDEEEEEEEEIDDTCPVGCDIDLYNHVILMREKKLDVEDVLYNIQKQSDEYKKIIERLRQREKQLIKDASQADMEMDEFQRQKQIALNQIQVIIPLKLSQLYPFETSGVFTVPSDQSPVDHNSQEYSDLVEAINSLTTTSERAIVEDIDADDGCILFNSKMLHTLNERIRELHEMIESSENHLRQHRKEKHRLRQEQKARLEEIRYWEEKCNTLQRSKYGRIVDLDALENECGDFRIENIVCDIEEREAEFKIEEEKIQKNIVFLQDELTSIIRKKTAIMNTIIEMTEAKNSAEKEFKNQEKLRSKSLLHGITDDKFVLGDMLKVSQEQINILDALKVELFMMRRKDIAAINVPNVDVPLKKISKKLHIPLRSTWKQRGFAGIIHSPTFSHRSLSASKLTDSDSSTSFVLPPIHK